jgi:hypothetical protein
MRPSRQLSGLLFLALAAVLAWGGTVHPALSTIRWLVVAAAAGWGVWTLRQERTRIEQVYVQILAMGLAISAVGWLIPTSQSRGLIVIGGLLVLASGGLLLWSWIQRRTPPSDDDANRTG